MGKGLAPRDAESSISGRESNRQLISNTQILIRRIRSNRQILMPLILIVLSLLFRMIHFGISMSFLDDYRKHSNKYDVGCSDLGDTYCSMVDRGEQIKTSTKCSVFNCGDKDPEDINDGNMHFPVSEFNKILMWTGAIICIIIFFARLFFDIIWMVRKLDSSQIPRAANVDNLREMVSFFYIFLDVFVIMWMFPLYSYRFGKECIRSLKDYDADDFKDQNESSLGYTFSLFSFSLVLLPVAYLFYRRFNTNDFWMKIFLIIALILNIIFTIVSTHRAWVARWAIYRTVGAFLFFMWLIYAGEIAMFWLGYYSNSGEVVRGEVAPI